MKKTGYAVLAAAALLLVCGCAMFNAMELEYAPHTTFGQELQDLKKAHEAGALTDEEYASLKQKLLKFADQLGKHLEDDDD